MSKKYTYEEVEKKFEEEGCKLLSKKYINCELPLDYICNCGNKSKIRFYNFLKGQRCKICGIVKRVKKRRYLFKYVYNYFKDHNCELLEKEYLNTTTLMRYKCSCGNISKIRFKKFKLGVRCNKCAIIKRAKKKRYSFKYVKNYFEEQGCELLEKEYIGINYKMKYKCNCGNISEIRFSCFKKGKRCRKCSVKRRTGENNYNWNFNKTNEERIIRRKYPKYREWRTKVFKRDSYICLKCRKKGHKLNAHHIESYDKNINLRLDIKNGVTFCRKCHLEFHKIYKNGNNTRKQFNEFIEKYKVKETV